MQLMQGKKKLMKTNQTMEEEMPMPSFTPTEEETSSIKAALSKLEVFARRKRVRLSDMCSSTKPGGNITLAGLQKDLVGFNGIVSEREIDVLLKHLAGAEFKCEENGAGGGLVNFKKIMDEMRDAHTSSVRSSKIKSKSVRANVLRSIDTNGEAVANIIRGDEKFDKKMLIKTKAKAAEAYGGYKFSFDENSPVRGIAPPTIGGGDENYQIQRIMSEEGREGDNNNNNNSNNNNNTNNAWLSSFDKRMEEALSRHKN
tara:strand:- start:484 stop:1254 length:771 start_codon:yes stop_codon:yes gene_type:complete